MNETKDSYTVMIFRGSVSGPLRFSFSRKFLKTLMLVGAGLLFVEILLLSQVIIRIGEMWELQALRAEVQSAREQTTVFSASVGDLKRRLLTMKEVNQRLRVMLGIDPQAPEGDILNGRGGEGGEEDTPLTTSQAASASRPSEAANASAVADSLNDASEAEAVISHDATAAKVQQDLAVLEALAGSEERALERLIEAAQGRQARWAAKS